ncbi:Ser/Thr protein kinase RdoA (MazF antagonist) [Kribbella sp. VKM Ac-2527]|uniref:Ser/Thr protein kinase RdoA (MazF antagonist) n=1 Tax=Kribbella caucasensis TaxID=2512215 RepID=A0A4R6JEJ3_9ACTN|nr:phosphotransferase [Kribbella sp. VKM Ac-2527]TDO34330.1 Ser/Thr protein kinase RdoA (MazF antagonist) [Kribbella sp. VKM Ac-2527]
MLWESTDPQDALRDRFGLYGFDEAVLWLTKVLAEVWGVDVESCERILISGHNAIAWIRSDRGAFVAKWSRAEGQFVRFAAAADLINALHQRGVPVAPPLESVDGRYREIVSSDSSRLSMTVQQAVDGQPLDTGNETTVRAAGASFAELHAALALHPDHRLIGSEPNSPADLRQRIEQWLAEDDSRIAPAASDRLREQISTLPPIDTEPQLIHNDYRSTNILTADTEIVAVVDFDEIAWDYAVCDLARTLVFLNTRFTDWNPTPANVRRTFLAGYESVRPLTNPEAQWLQALVLWRGIAAIPPGPDPAGWANAL